MSSRVIAIDGPAYVGKSSISKALAELTGFTYINTGHMYRAVAKKCLELGVSPADTTLAVGVAERTRIEFKRSGIETRTWVDGQEMTHALNAPEIVLAASEIAGIGALRGILTARQRNYAKNQTIIMEGRDIGSQVFPDAEWKFFVTARLEVRARRMLKMMAPEEREKFSDTAELIPKIQELDKNDTEREIAPLIQPKDAVVYDNSESPTAAQDAGVLNDYISGKKASVKV